MKLLLAFLMPLCLAVSAPADAAERSPASRRLQAVLSEYDQVLSATDPLRAAQRGELGALALWPDESPAALAALQAKLAALRGRLLALQGARLAPEAALNRDLLLQRLGLDLQGLAFDEARLPYNAGDGFYTVPNYAADGVVLRDEAQARAWLAKIAALPAFYRAQMENLRRGAATGFVRPRLIAARTAASLRSRAEQPAESHALLRPLADLPAGLPAALQSQLRAQALALVRDRVKPAERELADAFEREILPRASADLGITALPGGAAYYAYLIQRHASTAMSADAIHALGVQEVARVQAEMDALIASTGFKGPFAEYLAALRGDPRQRAASMDDYLQRTRDIAKRADALLPAYFRTLPRLSYGVRVVAPEMKESSSGYNPGSLEQGVAGTVLVNFDAVEQSPLYLLPAWTLHEGVPGHHLQIALAQERSDLPAFRRLDDINAYVEGWALYSERLGLAMGIYRSPEEHFGRLALEMWRACRLVIDTGLHARGWSREQAVSYLRDRAALSPAFIEGEIDRYIGWPAQALGYKLGELRIRALRARAESELGARFDLREFHDAILRPGPMPLDLLEREIERWIGAQRSTPVRR